MNEREKERERERERETHRETHRETERERERESLVTHMNESGHIESRLNDLSGAVWMWRIWY